ncbi:reverse transcriptase domain-containing protein [Tanacetum coccineum]
MFLGCVQKVPPNMHAKEDEEKTSFHTEQGAFCYGKMPFRLKNVGATYQRLMDNMFTSQLSRNIKIYVDDMVIKIRNESSLILDIAKTFDTLRKANMKFNPKKCTKIITILQNTKRCLNNKDFQWSIEAEMVFQELKSHLQSLPALTIPRPGETLVLYLAAATKVPHSAIKGQVLANFLAESPTNNNVTVEKVPHAYGKDGMSTWTLFTDGASNIEGYGDGLILTDPGCQKITYALCFNFRTSNNEAEYEALVAGLELAIQMEAQCLDAYIDSLLIVNQVKEVYEGSEDLMKRYLSKVQEMQKQFKSFMITQVSHSRNKCVDALSKLASSSFAHLTKNVLVEITRALPNDTNKVRKIRIKAPQYSLNKDVLYKKGYLTPWLRYVRPEQANYVLREAHFGSCGAHAEACNIAQKVARLGYYWPTMYQDATKTVEKCHKCQQHAPTVRQPQCEITSISSPWPFYQWVIDIVGPFPEALGQVKFLIVTIEYFIKWVEAEPIATITSHKMLKFVWRNIVCHFGIPKIIISDNRKQFAIPSEVVSLEVSPSAPQLRARILTNNDATDSGPEPSFDHAAIFGVSFQHRCLYHKSLQKSKLIVTTSFVWSGPEVYSRGLLRRSALEFRFGEYVDTTSFSFRGSELVRGASSSHGCSISLEILPYQRLFHHPLVEIISLNFLARLASRLPYPSVFRCVKLYNIAYVVLICSGVNASWSNVFVDHTTILAAKDACLPAPTPDEVIYE